MRFGCLLLVWLCLVVCFVCCLVFVLLVCWFCCVDCGCYSCVGFKVCDWLLDFVDLCLFRFVDLVHWWLGAVFDC